MFDVCSEAGVGGSQFRDRVLGERRAATLEAEKMDCCVASQRLGQMERDRATWPGDVRCDRETAGELLGSRRFGDRQRHCVERGKIFGEWAWRRLSEVCEGETLPVDRRPDARRCDLGCAPRGVAVANLRIEVGARVPGPSF